MKSIGALSLVTGLTLAAWLALRLAGSGPEIWTTWQPDGCLFVNCYCEPVHASLVRQTIATESNLGFLAVGLAVAAGLFRVHDRRRWIAAAMVVATAVGSTFYHASLTRVGDWADLMGTFGLVILFGSLSAWRRWPAQRMIIAAAAAVALAIGGVQMVLAPALQQVVLGVLVLLAIALESLAPAVPTQRPWLWAGLACFLIGGGVWIGSSAGLLPCWPNAPMTWHGVWHLLAAGGAGLLCRYHLPLQPVTDERRAA